MRVLVLLAVGALLGAAAMPGVPQSVDSGIQQAEPSRQSAPPAKPAEPFSSEGLHYTVNWPSGLSLGEGSMKAGRSGSEWRFELSLDASIPGFTVLDSFRSTAAGDFCSTEFVKDSTHGKKKANETTTFDTSRRVATRETLKGGKSELQIPACPRDALGFLYYLRRELSQGRLPPPQTVYFGAPYQLRLEYGGALSVRANDRPYSADRIVAYMKGPASDLTFEMFFARDAARTPLVIRTPLAIGTFSMELAP